MMDTATHVAGPVIQIGCKHHGFRMIQRCTICGLKLLDAMGNDLPPGRPFDPGAVVRVDSAEPPAMMVVRAEQEGPLPFDSCIELVEAAW